MDMTSKQLSRRNFMKYTGISASIASLPSISYGQSFHFPANFKWGVGSAAAQVESRKGRGQSNWDVFIDAGKHIRDGSNNKINTDFENRYMEDFQLLASAGVQSFRFSFSWPRIQPKGPGSFNAEAIDTYDRIIDNMLKLGLEPFATMFHWDTPVWAGDFRDRNIANHMAQYADIITRKFGDRINMWALLNEPNSVAFAGYAIGVHAPGIASANAAGAAIHHQNLSQGLMAQVAKSNLDSSATLTTTINLAPIRAAASDIQKNQSVVSIADDFWNKAFLDPIYGKGYPLSIMPLVDPYIKENDMDIIDIRPKAIGINYYSRVYVKNSPESPLGFLPDTDGAPKNVLRTDDYFFEPDGLIETLQRVHKNYSQPEIIITETGFAIKDTIPENGLVKDSLREKYLRPYLQAAYDSIAQGINLSGIYYWSATDNFEWSDGFSKKFGLIQVDPDTLKRTAKTSLYYYGKCAKANAIV